MPMVTGMLVVAHATAGALWLGSMAYSLFVVQPRLSRMLQDPAGLEGPAPDPGQAEHAQQVLATGNRWPVVAMITLLWVTGVGLVALAAGETGSLWWAGVAFKAALLAAATGLFWWVSWRAWPRRVFALPEELPGLQRRFRVVAVTMLALVAAAFVTGVVTGAV